MRIPLSKSDIRHACGDRAYTRGLGYTREGRVIRHLVEDSDSGWELHAEVLGNTLYTQHIFIERFDDALEIEGDCSCPVAFNCKHIAAVLIQLQQDQTGSPQQRQIDTWLQRLDDAQTPEQWAPGLGDLTLRYVLKPSGTPTHGVKVELQVLRVLKSGKGLGKAVTVPLYDTYDARLRKAMQPLDDSIVRLLRSHAGYSAPILHGDLGAAALWRMLDTGRLHWLAAGNPALTVGEMRPLHAAWQREGAVHRLRVETEPAGALPIAVDPTAYLDPRQMTIGPLQLDAGINYRMLDALLQAPDIPDELTGPLTDQLLQNFPGARLPMPIEQQIDEITADVRPVARLSAQRHPSSERLVHWLAIEFDYDGWRVGPPFDAITQLRAASGVTRVLRDSETELAALQRLFACGFVPWDGSDAVNPRLVLPADEIHASALLWRRFIDEELPRLEADGWIIEQEEAFALRFGQVDEITLDINDGGSWFDIGIGVDIEGQRIDLIPMLAQLAGRIGRPEDLPDDQPLIVEVAEAQWVELPASRVKPLLIALFDLFDRATGDSDGLRLARIDAVRLAELDDGIAWQGGESLRALAKRLADSRGIPSVAPPAGLQAELRAYQLHGVAWLQFMRETGFGGLLADDMGLGKTMQTLAHLLIEQQAGRLDRPALLVAPTSLMANWRHEALQFAPSLRVLTLQGPERKARFDAIADHDLVLTTYPLLPRDAGILGAQAYHCLILDEAQTIKNPRAKAAQIVRKIDARQRICLTGTPMENHLGELWSLFHFLNPGYLGDLQSFRRLYRSPIEENGDQQRRRSLQRRIAPFLLRRTKQAVASELPDKVEIVRTVALDDGQAGLYESVRAAMDKRVRDALSEKGLARSHITILDALLKLRQICCDPRLVKLDHPHAVNQSAKLDLLMQMLPELVDEGRRILLFSQFTSMLSLIEEQLKPLRIAYTKLTGQTRKREAAIQRFRSGEVPLFLISLKAGGVGLNLTEADTVIHYDPWWNPAVENQATDRAHRIGQSKKVFVYKLVVESSVEEKILALQAKKSRLADGIYRQGEQGSQTPFSETDLQELLRPPD